MSCVKASRTYSIAGAALGALILAGREIQPSGIPKLIQGIVLMCLIASDFMLRYRVRLRRADTMTR